MPFFIQALTCHSSCQSKYRDQLRCLCLIRKSRNSREKHSGDISRHGSSERRATAKSEFCAAKNLPFYAMYIFLLYILGSYWCVVVVEESSEENLLNRFLNSSQNTSSTRDQGSDALIPRSLLMCPESWLNSF